MAFILEFEESTTFELNSPYEKVFAMLSDVPTAMSYHPAVHELEDLGKGRYRLAMQKVGTKKHFHQTVYTCDYISDESKGSVIWTPVREDGNAWVDGSFDIRKKGDVTTVTMAVVSELTIPLPAIMKSMAYKIANAENEKMTKRYVENLIQQCSS